jgi:hypothetical protein
MRGDFSRMSFDRKKHYLRVLEQQGRVQLDADWNEQGAILLHYLQTLTRDLIGAHAGPGDDDFRIKIVPSGGGDSISDLEIGFGRYYVEGLLCENEALDECGRPAVTVSYYNQPHFYRDREKDDQRIPTDLPFLVYLDVWERHITSLQDEDLREVALLGPDTATRSQVVWQVKTEVLEGGENTCAALPWDALVEKWQAPNRGCMRARAKPGASSTDACILPPESRYRGFENQLYRVEIHEVNRDGRASFKWSRNNGSVVFPVEGEVSGKVITLASLGRDGGYSLEKGDWVEIVDDHYEEEGRTEPLLKVTYVDRASRQVTLEGSLPPGVGESAELHPLLRRWDQQASGQTQLDSSGAISLEEGRWIDLENQVQVFFEPGGNYRAGDYWLIPARVATGDVIWPKEAGVDAQGNRIPALKPPEGIRHYYAPLAIVTGIAVDPVSCRNKI